jgi:hypothetical protein
VLLLRRTFGAGRAQMSRDPALGRNASIKAKALGCSGRGSGCHDVVRGKEDRRGPAEAHRVGGNSRHQIFDHHLRPFT